MLQVCRDREGRFKTELFERYQRSEKALVACITEMYFSGVSTRKVAGIMEELCGYNLSKSYVSQVTEGMDAGLKEWRERPLNGNYPYLILDARYEKVRENGRVVSKAFVVAIGISEEGVRDVVGCWMVNSESFEAWDTCIRSLKDRGLTGVKYVVSDENKGLRLALQKYFQEANLQRCQVHFMRNFIGKLAKSEQAEGIRLLQAVFAADTKEEALKRVIKVNEFLLSKKKEKVADWLEENIEDTLAVLDLPREHRKKMKSTNMLERLNQELKRRSRVVRIFPNEESCLRLLGALCQETSEAWSGRKYLTM
jgi:putative transposase